MLLLGISLISFVGSSPTSSRLAVGGQRFRSMEPTMAAGNGAYGFSVNDLDSNKAVDLSQFQGSVSLMVNVASK